MEGADSHLFEDGAVIVDRDLNVPAVRFGVGVQGVFWGCSVDFNVWVLGFGFFVWG